MGRPAWYGPGMSSVWWDAIAGCRVAWVTRCIWLAIASVAVISWSHASDHSSVALAPASALARPGPLPSASIGPTPFNRPQPIDQHGSNPAELPPNSAAPARCCGCLCADPSWSCSLDTCVSTESGTVETLEAESGFFAIELERYRLRGQLETTPRERIWYAFQPARHEATRKPLVVFFNGGPGSSTAPLFGFNTGERRVTGVEGSSAGLEKNPNSWTQWANLLWIDAPNTGFSYLLPAADGQKPSAGVDPDRDAGSFIRVITRFLTRHPMIADNRIILVGESWGGTRAALMLHKVLDYESLPTMYPAADPELHEELRAFFAERFPGTGGKGLTPGQIAEQWGHQVHIQSLLAGSTQESAMRAQMPRQGEGCLANGDLYQCDRPDGYTFDRIFDVAAQLVQLDRLETALGVDPRSIAWMHAEHRKGAYGRRVSPSEGARVDLSQMQAQFGELGPEDSYYIATNHAVFRGYPGARSAQDTNIGRAFLWSAYHTEVLLTHAAFDRRIWAPAFAQTFARYSDYVDAARMLDGAVEIDYRDSELGSNKRVHLAYASYPDAGHIVSLRAPAQLRSDVRRWFESWRGEQSSGRRAELGPIARGPELDSVPNSAAK